MTCEYITSFAAERVLNFACHFSLRDLSLNSSSGENPLGKGRQLLEDLDCDLRAVTMQLAALQRSTLVLHRVRTALQDRRQAVLASVNAFLDTVKPTSPAPPVARLPHEVLVRIRDEDDCVRWIDYETARDNDPLNNAEREARPILIEFPYDQARQFGLSAAHLSVLENSSPDKLDVLVKIIEDSSIARQAWQDLTRCLVHSARWNRLEITFYYNVLSAFRVLKHCAPSLPYIRHLDVSERGESDHNDVQDSLPVFPEAGFNGCIRSASLYPSLLRPLQHLLLNITHLELEVPFLRSASQFHSDVIPYLPRTLESFAIKRPARFRDETSGPSEHLRWPMHEFPLLKNLVFEDFDGVDVLLGVLRVFDGLNPDELTIVPSDDRPGQKGVEHGREVLETIDSLFPTLSILSLSLRNLRYRDEFAGVMSNLVPTGNIC